MRVSVIIAVEDIGVRKMRSQNNGIIASSADYLIFIEMHAIYFQTLEQS